MEATLERLSPTVRDMVMLQRYTGARPGEICNLRPGDVNRAASVWELVPGSHKTEHHDKQRVVFIGPRGQQILLPYLLRAADSCCFSPAEVEAARRAEQAANRKTPLSCVNRPGSNCKQKPKRRPKHKYTTTSYGRAISRAAEAAGVEVWTPHQLRQEAEGDSFFLSCRMAASLVDVEYPQASLWLRGLPKYRILVLVNKGQLAGRRASVYRYIGD